MSTLETFEAKLQEPFEQHDIKWRIQRCGMITSANSGKIWATAVPYITSRAIQDRLDSVFGVFNWEVTHREVFGPRPAININAADISDERLLKLISSLQVPSPMDGFLTTLKFKDPATGEWITKQDASNLTDIESLKGGASGGLKRAGALTGIGRYLYQLKPVYVQCFPCDRPSEAVHNYWVARVGGSSIGFDWVYPTLPSWALPGLDTTTFEDAINVATSIKAINEAYENATKWANSFARKDLLEKFKVTFDLAASRLEKEALENIDANRLEVESWLDKQIKNINAVPYAGGVSQVSATANLQLIEKCQGQLFDAAPLYTKLKLATKTRIDEIEGK